MFSANFRSFSTGPDPSSQLAQHSTALPSVISVDFCGVEAASAMVDTCLKHKPEYKPEHKPEVPEHAQTTRKYVIASNLATRDWCLGKLRERVYKQDTSITFPLG